MIADWHEVETASSHAKIPIKRFKASEVTAVSDGIVFRFPMRDGTLKQAGMIPPNPARRAFSQTPARSDPLLEEAREDPSRDDEGREEARDWLQRWSDPTQ